MKAQVLVEHGTIDEIVFHSDFDMPKAGPGEVLVRVKACALNYHDVFTMRGMPGIKVPLPIIMGIDAAGEVAALGDSVSGWSQGDRVIIDPINRKTGKLFGEMVHGGLAEYAVVDETQLVALPDGIDFATGAALPCAYGTAYRMMFARGNVKAGEKVLILGASGGVGTCCVQLAKLAGAHVIVAASSTEKLAKLAGLGADEGINYVEEDFMRWVHTHHGKPRIMGEGGVDVVVNFTGGDTWVRSLRSLKKYGRMLTCGATAGFDPKTDIRYIWTFEQSIIGSNGWEKSDISALLDLVADGKMMPAIETRYPLSETRQAFADLETRRAFGKLIIEP